MPCGGSLRPELRTRASFEYPLSSCRPHRRKPGRAHRRKSMRTSTSVSARSALNACPAEIADADNEHARVLGHRTVRRLKVLCGVRQEVQLPCVIFIETDRFDLQR